MSELLLEENPLVLELRTLRAAVVRFQEEAHASAVKLQRYSLDSTKAHERATYLERENDLLKSEVALLRANPHPDDGSNHPDARSQIQELTLALRRLSQKIESTEDALLAKTTDLIGAQAEVVKAKAAAEGAYELGARVRGREEAALARERDLQNRILQLEEDARMSDVALTEYAALVREMEHGGRKSGPGSKANGVNGETDGPQMSALLYEGKVARSNLVAQFQAENEKLQDDAQRINSELEVTRSLLEAEAKTNAALVLELANVKTALDKLNLEDNTAAKMVSRYMRFSQNSTNDLLDKLSALKARHEGTLATISSQNHILSAQLRSSEAQASHLLRTLDELGGEIMKEAWGRRREVGLRLRMGGREERVVEAIRRWVRKGEELLTRISVASAVDEGLPPTPDASREALLIMAQDARILLGSLEDGAFDEDLGISLSGSKARMILLGTNLDGLLDELKVETERRFSMQKQLASLGLRSPQADFAVRHDEVGRKEEHDLPRTPEEAENAPEAQDDEPPMVPEKTQKLPIDPPHSVTTLGTQLPAISSGSKESDVQQVPLIDSLVSRETPNGTPDAGVITSEPSVDIVITEPASQEPASVHDGKDAIEEGLPIDLPITPPHMEGSIPIQVEEVMLAPGVEQDIMPSPTTSTPSQASEVSEFADENVAPTPGTNTDILHAKDVLLSPPLETLNLPPENKVVESAEKSEKSPLISVSAAVESSAASPPLLATQIGVNDHGSNAVSLSTMTDQVQVLPLPTQMDKNAIGASLMPEVIKLPDVPATWKIADEVVRRVSSAIPDTVAERSDAEANIEPVVRASPGTTHPPSNPISLSPFASSTRPEIQAPARHVHPLLEELAYVTKRYDDLQRAFRDCHHALETLKASLRDAEQSRSPVSPVISQEILSAALGRLDDYTEDARVELEIRVGDEALLAKGYEALLSVPGAMENTSLSAPDEEHGEGGHSQSEVEKQISEFVSGTDPAVRRARDTFSRKLDDVQHDIAALKRAIHDPESLGVALPASDILQAAQSSTATLVSPSASTTDFPDPGAGQPSTGWSSWIRGASRPASPAPPVQGPAPTFGNIMTAPRLRHAPSFGNINPSTMPTPMQSPARSRRPSFFGLGAGPEPPASPLAALELRVPMPNFASVGNRATPLSAGAFGGTYGGLMSPASPLKSSGMAPAVRTRTVSSTMYMLGLGAGGASSSAGGRMARASSTGTGVQAPASPLRTTGTRPLHSAQSRVTDTDIRTEEQTDTEEDDSDEVE